MQGTLRKEGFQKEKVVRSSKSYGLSRKMNPTAASGLRNSEVIEDSGEEGSTKEWGRGGGQQMKRAEFV